MSPEVEREVENVMALSDGRRYANATEMVKDRLRLGMAYIQARDAFAEAVRVACVQELEAMRGEVHAAGEHWDSILRQGIERLRGVSVLAVDP